MFAALIVTSLGAGICFAPALTMLSDVAEAARPAPGLRRRPLQHGLGRRARWSAASAAAASPSAAGNAAPSLAIAVLLLVTAPTGLRRIAPALVPRPATQV